MAVLDASLIETFHRDGFVVVEDFFDFDELDLFGSIVDRAVKNRVGSDSRSVDEKSLYEQSFQQCMNLWEDNADLKEFTFDQKLGETAGLLLGAEALRIWHDQALYKEPGGRETDPHQDWPLWPMGPARQITAWIPFDGSTLRGGAMGWPSSLTSPGSYVNIHTRILIIPKWRIFLGWKHLAGQWSFTIL